MTLPLHGYPDWQNPLHTADLQAQLLTTTLNVGVPFFSATFDMRPYQSWSASIDTLTTGIATAFNSVSISFRWSDDAAGTNAVFMDIYHIFGGSNLGGAFNYDSGRLQIQDAVHGPYLTIVMVNQGADQITVSGKVFGNTRSIAKPYVRNNRVVSNGGIDTQDSMLLNAGAFVPIGSFQEFPFRMAAGPCAIHLVAGTATALTFDLFTPKNEQIYTIGLGAGGVIDTQWILPRTAVKLRVTHPGGPANNFLANIVSGLTGQ